MNNPLSSDEMRILERRVIDSGKIAGIDLMERAGEGVVAAIHEYWPECKPSQTHVLVLCGPGNNGGDGFVIARLMARLGYPVDLFLYGDPQRLPDDAKRNHDLWVAQGCGSVKELSFPKPAKTDVEKLSHLLEMPDPIIVIDALFGIGLTRPLTALQDVLVAYHTRRRKLSETETLYAAVDVPSGLTDDGPIGGLSQLVFQADLTVTFHSLKKAHVHGKAYCGRIVVHDIGL